MNELALMYMDGEGVARDLDRAIALLQDSLAAGFQPAGNNLGIAYATRNRPGDLQLAYQALLVSTKQGNRFAAANARKIGESLAASERFAIEQSMELALAR